MSALNISSLIKHFDDLANDAALLQSDAIIITETNFHLDFEPRKLDGYVGYDVKGGRGKGNRKYMDICTASVLINFCSLLNRRHYICQGTAQPEHLPLEQNSHK